MKSQEQEVKYGAIIDIEDMQDQDSQTDDDSQNDFSDSDIKEQEYEYYEKIRFILTNINGKKTDKMKREEIEKMKRSNAFKKVLEGYNLPNIVTDGKPDYYINVLTFLLQKCKDEVFKHNEKEEIFFAAALLQKEEVDRILQNLMGENNLDYVRDSKTVIHFILRYGNLGNRNIVDCIRKFIDAGVDLNVYDFDGSTALDQVIRLYNNCSNKENASVKRTNLKEIAQALIDSNKCYIDDNAKAQMKNIIEIDEKALAFCLNDVNKTTQAFNLLIKENANRKNPNKTAQALNSEMKENATRKRKKSKKQLLFDAKDIEDVNSDNGEDTLLQLACKMNSFEVVEGLLKRGAKPNQSTAVNRATPLELCALRNYEELFKLILSSINEVTPEQFHNFVRKRGVVIKTCYFNLLLESGKLNVDYKFETSSNTPLHYAIYFSQSDAIQNLLKRGASLFEKNASGDSPLKIIDESDLERYFDSCLILDRHNTYVSDPNYKVQFDFSCFFCEGKDEWKLIYQIGESERLQNLLKHPLLYTFLSMKWLEAQRYFYLIFTLQTLIYFPLLVMFFFFDNPSDTLLLVTFLGSLCNVIKIITVLINHNEDLYTEKSYHCKFLSILENFGTNINYSFTHATLHCILECLVTVEMVTVCMLHYIVPRHSPTIAYSAQIRAFIFVGIVLIWLLTLGYHPKVSKWSVMIRKIYKTFSALILVLSIPIIAFAMGFHTIWTNLNQNKVGSSNESFVTLPSSIFKTYIMSTGDLSLDYDHLKGFAIYFYFIIFAISMAIIIMNFFLAIACRDMDDMEKNSELNSIKNIIIFLYFVDSFHGVCSTLSITNVLKYRKISKLNPFRTPRMLYKMNPENRSTERQNEAITFKIDFFVNKAKPFSFSNSREESEKMGIDGACLDKIKKYIINKNIPERIKNAELNLESLQAKFKKIDEIYELLVRDTPTKS